MSFVYDSESQPIDRNGRRPQHQSWIVISTDGLLRDDFPDGLGKSSIRSRMGLARDMAMRH
jgi:hypothetical protein